MNFVRYQSPYPTSNCNTQYGTGFYSASFLWVYTNVNGFSSNVFSYGNEQFSSYPNNCYDYSVDGIRSVILPADSQGGVRVIYQMPNHTFSNGNVNGTSTYILSEYISSNGQTAWESPLVGGLGSNGYGNQEFSAVADANYGSHVVYKWQNGTVSYSYRGASSSNWTSPSSVFSGPVRYPTLSADYSTGDVYAFAVSGSSILMRRKALIQSWQDESIISVVTGRPGQLTGLTSNSYYASTSVNASRMLLVWTEPAGSSFNVMFASLPATTVWSPYSYPSDPWDGNGLAPYGVYFSNLGEYVSPSTGLLTVSQTDMSLAGRGLNLELTRVYTQPGAFLSGAPYNYENYPWAPLGKGWQLNFPWMGIGNPDYLHLWNGEGYRIPLSFWTGTTGIFENHQGENFRLIRSSGGSIALYTSSGTSYNFDSVHRLTSIIDPTLANHINFTYSGNFMASIIDTVGRVFLFCYSSGQLKSINETSNSGSCSSRVGSVRGIVFTYNGSSLTNATDALGRSTTYQYDPTTGGGGWLISKITYATKWYASYTYASAPLGTEVTFYRIKLQLVGSPSASSPIRQAGYSYSQGIGDQVTNSTVTSYSGTSIMSYTLLAFSPNGISENITDANHNFLRGVFQQFGEDGEVIKETLLVSPTQGYSNYYSYDLWGNRIYDRESINPSTSWYHERFNAYYNDGLPPGFNAFQESFSENQGNAADNRWFTTSPTWAVGNAVFQGSDTADNLFANFAWTNMSAPDVSLQARMFITKQPTNATNLAGIFGRYSGSGTAKLSLGVSISLTGSGVALLQEDGTTYGAGSSCSINNPVRIWYTLNLTIQGSSAMGWLQPDGGQCQATISLPYTSAGPPGSIGLEVTGLSALFDNITVTTTRPPYTAGNGFSNEFIQNGAPGSGIHDAIAGIAEFQNVTGTTAPVPLEAYYTYYPWGELNQTRQGYNSPSGEVWLTTARTYDSFGNLLTLTDSRGNTTALTYSTSYKSAYLTSETQTLRPGSTQITSQYGYNLTTGTRLWSVDPNGYNTTYKYDILNRLTRISYPNNLGYTSNSYNDTGNYVDITNENGWKTRQVYDGLGRLTTIERFNKGAWYSNQTSTHNWRDQLTSTVDPMHNATSYQYDILGRLVSTTEPNGNLTSTTYNDLSSWTRTTDENRVNKCYVYDRLGRLLSVVENASSACQPSIVTNYYYDEIGDLAKVTTSTIQSTTYVYDNLNRLVKTNYPDHTNETYSYDNNGYVATKVDREGITSQYSYDSLNRPLTVTMLANPVSTKTYSYDNNGNILSLGSTNATIAYTYDSRNRVTSETYSVNGNFSLSVFPNKVSFFCTPTNCTPTSSNTTLTITSINGFSGPISLSYTPTNAGTGGTLITGKNSTFLPSGGKVQATITAYLGTQSGLWNWTITGRSGSSTASTVFMISQYVCYRNCPTSPIGGPTSPSQSSLSSPSGSSGVAASYRVGYAYGGELLSNITYPDNILLHYGYDGLGRAVNVSRISGVFVTPYANFAYNKNDQLTYIGYYNGFQSNYTYTNYTYDSLGRTSTITLVQSGKKPVNLLSLTYQYNRTSTVASVIGSVQTSPVNEQYKYDTLHRLINTVVTSNGATTTSAYRYDTVGNRLTQTVNNQQTNYMYNATNNELRSSSGPGGAPTYSYDADGNLIGVTNGYSYTWDPAGTLVKVTSNAIPKSAYAYDGQGRQVESTDYNIFYAYLGTETLYENNTASKTTTDYIYAVGMRLGKISAGAVNYYHTDALGSTRLVTDPSGNVLFADGYRPFGQDNGVVTGSQNYRFYGQTC